MPGKEADDFKISLSTPPNEVIMFFSRYTSYQKSTSTFERSTIFLVNSNTHTHRIEFKKDKVSRDGAGKSNSSKQGTFG